MRKQRNTIVKIYVQICIFESKILETGAKKNWWTNNQIEQFDAIL